MILAFYIIYGKYDKLKSLGDVDISASMSNEIEITNIEFSVLRTIKHE